MKNTTKKTNQQMGLEVKSFPKHKQWAVDQDYTKSLSKEEQDWLGRFNQEFYRNRFDGQNDLHDTPELKKQCYSRENAANRDLYAVKATGGMVGSFTKSDEDGNEIDMLDTLADSDYLLEQHCADLRLDAYNESKRKARK